MAYFVVAPDGLFGPADLALLSEWAKDGCIGPDSLLEEEGTSLRVKASTLPGLRFAQNSAPPSPLPPNIVSNYRRPNWEPPLFLESEVNGRRELLYAFLLALGGPIIAIFAIYGIAAPLGGIFAACVALKRGRKLAILALILNLVAFPAAIAAYFAIHFF